MKKQGTDMVKNPNHRFMEQNLSTVINRTPYTGVGVSDYMTEHYQFHIIFFQTHQESFYLKEIFKSVHSRFLGTRSFMKSPSIRRQH